jgi:hypothetical protein
MAAEEFSVQPQVGEKEGTWIDVRDTNEEEILAV